ncbi:TonB-dependent siderophore receptor [Afipia clevelandensis]|uniref:TonB-dependent siderophore receptor n=1 Tax=Afipia clevelandensis ATCC 49720 TaxID=883079 RepID=K8PBR4_9BRAD|nr:TonB-dependent siderophore receptor [Afipia clevelandensis]EKS35748.1 TonB-dependent siderophore receptor [Afipia clevelandensis ATCC 49720]
MQRLLSRDVLRVTMRSALGVAILGSVCHATPSFAQSSEPPSEKPSATTLPEVRVAGQRTRPRRAPRVAPAPAPVQQPAPVQAGETGTGPVVGYSARQSVTATKTDTPLLETPQSVSVVTKDQVQDQGAQSVQDALRYTPGVSLQGYGANAFFDGVKLRGFDAPRYLDGLRLPTDSTTFAMPKIEPYGLERIEVLRGPSSGLYGQSDPGGLINMVSKRPTATPHYDFETTFGNFNYKQGAFDIGGPIDKNGEFLYRIVGLGRLADTQTDFMQDNKIFIAPSFTWRPTNDTSFTILSQYQKIDNKGYQQYVPGQVSFLPNPNGPVPYSRYLGEPSVDGYKLEQKMIGYAFEHRFDNNIQFRQNMRYTEVTNDLQSTRSEGMDPTNPTQSVARSYNYVKASAQNVALDNQLQADFRTGILTHKVLVGADYLHQTGSVDYRNQGSIIYFPFGSFPSINAYNPVYGAAVPSFTSLTPFILNDNKIDQVGIYAQDQIKLDRWTLSLTGRQDFVNSELISKAVYPQAGTYQRSDSAQTGRVGLNYLFDFGLSPYINYSTSFVPNTGAGLDLKPFKPTTGDGKEIGVKFMPNGTNLMLSAALFEINQNNVLTGNPLNPFLSIQTDAARSRGFEFEARGNVTRELEIIAAYTKIDAKVTKSLTPANVGKYLNGVPLDQGSLWAKYTWFDGSLAGLGIGAGVRYVGESYGDATNSFVLPSYTLFDASVSYDLAYARPDLKGWKAQINATNLANKYYTVSCLTGLPYCGLGTARTVLGTLKYSWNEGK